MFRFFEGLVRPLEPPPAETPPADLMRFYWHFIRQMKWQYAALFVTSMLASLIDTAVPIFLGQVVELMTATDRQAAIQNAWPMLTIMLLIVLIGRPAAHTLDSLMRNNAVAPAGNTMVRWQSHWHVVRQSWSFFQKDFAGRVANRVMQAGHALRESVVSSIRAVWYIAVYGTTAIVLMAAVDWRLAMPAAIWCVGYLLLMRHFVPRMRDLSRETSEMRSMLMGRIVDSYTNILTVKLFAKAEEEDRHVRDGLHLHLTSMQRQNRVATQLTASLSLLNAFLLVSTAVVALSLWAQGSIEAAAVAMALPLTDRIAHMAGWVVFEVTAIFENVGVVQESTESIAVPHSLLDKPGAKDLKVTQGAVHFENITFGYGRERGVIRNLTLEIKPGEKIGLIGRSGAGKSTLVNLLLRFYDLESGRIVIDGQDIAQVTQESLRGQIAVVTQDTSLLHRSIAENIRYGRREASEREVYAAAEKAHAHEFIEQLEDWRGRTGYEAHVGERGVKLSGGQRQRVAIARVILKNAPILVLDEATSALDSEVEAAIQEQLEGLMEGKTVVAIAHRLSTIARMDRLIIMDDGRIIEQGTHAELLALGGHYADLWNRQSGGFLSEAVDPDTVRQAAE
jgi:ATP-binding cassette subfamily B multidrug efflux pump